MAAANSREAPQMEPSAVNQLPENTNCLACSEDGRYLGLGHSQGLTVWRASSFTRVTDWLRDRLEITLIQMTRMAERTYLLGTVDDMGAARVFALHSNDIHLLSVINVMEDVNKRSVCWTFELCEGGRYGAASFSCYGAAWLEVLQFPLAAWLRELESSQKQDQKVAKEMGVKWSPVTVMNKITPEVPSGRTGDGVGRTWDYFTHFLALDVIRGGGHQRENLSFRTDAGVVLHTSSCPVDGLLVTVKQVCCQVCLSLLPCGGPGAITSFNVAPTPDVLWPNAKEIVCSAVSRCTRFIGLGLEDAAVCIWDRRSGAPLSIISLPAENGALLRMQLVANWTASVHESQVFTAEPVLVLVLCKSGAVYTIAAERGPESCAVQLTERPKDSGDLPTVIVPVPFLQAVILVVQRNGKMFLQDVADKTTVCFLTPPTSHRIASPCSPVYALNAKQQVLFIRADQETSCGASSNTSSQTQLFVFRFERSEIVKPYVVSHPETPRQQPTLCCDTLENFCDLYLQQRVLSADERSEDFEQTWGRLQETVGTIQQRQQGHEHLN